ncbi:BON domain-containing protein [Rubrivirga sp. S365]|uniref:BON domain-containing protein n=1 Tax=Rubrivirga sp. S365 TaxID=3076080 RepID=UPI0028C85933|nr:BON domain-containing protein [Rubrivirga sp. S365]MDT7857272.1 BON domain-containing protein [Rubrivirga sp. S365]
MPRLFSGLRAAVARAQRRRTQTSADADLAHALHDGVEAAGLAARGLAFYVHDGVVSVYGDVADRAAREALIDVVVEAPGVQRVVDHLRIEGA